MSTKQERYSPLERLTVLFTMLTVFVGFGLMAYAIYFNETRYFELGAILWIVGLLLTGVIGIFMKFALNVLHLFGISAPYDIVVKGKSAVIYGFIYIFLAVVSFFVYSQFFSSVLP